MRTNNLKRLSAAISAIALLVAGMSISPAKAESMPFYAAPNKVVNESTVGIQMFMYPWTLIGTECTKVLGPSGIDWVQISPPQEHIRGEQWWVHYQPVSYKIDSSLGDRAEFAAMVQACNKAGVMIIADTVINHMANSNGIGFANTEFSKFEYPGLFGEDDFHGTMSIDEPRYCDSNISNYDEVWETTSCMLGGLPDLATEKESVRNKIAAYLDDLTSLGVAGFRVDAAKHLGVVDLKAIIDRLNPVNGRQPIVMSEVIGGSGSNAPFTEFGYAWAWSMPDLLEGALRLQAIKMGTSDAWTVGFNGSAKTITMVGNHDTEHHGPTSIPYWEGKKFQLAHIFMLATKFGIPEIYTGYTFSDENNGPNRDPNSGKVLNAKCATTTTKPSTIVKDGVYTCVQRWSAIQGMIAWRDAAGTNKQYRSYYTKYAVGKILQFNRGTNFIAMNPTGFSQKATLKTWMPPGNYCDVISGGKAAKKTTKTCVGTKIVVDKLGQTVVTVPALGAIAFGAFTKLN
jgi:alpha-amylase